MENTNEKSISLDEFYNHIISHLTPEEALKRLLAGTVDQYTQMRGLEGNSGQPEMIIAMAAFELGWGIAFDKSENEIKGLVVGTEEYMNSIFNK